MLLKNSCVTVDITMSYKGYIVVKNEIFNYVCNPCMAMM